AGRKCRSARLTQYEHPLHSSTRGLAAHEVGDAHAAVLELVARADDQLVRSGLELAHVDRELELRLAGLRELLAIQLDQDRLDIDARDRDVHREPLRRATPAIRGPLGVDVRAPAAVPASCEADSRAALGATFVLAQDLDLVTARAELAARDRDLEVGLLRGGDLLAVEEHSCASQPPWMDADLQLELARDAALVGRESPDRW